MNESAIKHLDVVRLLLKEQRKAIAAIRQTTHKRVGSCTFQLSIDEKAEMIQKMQTRYKQQIAMIYTHMNAEREADGREPLTNPFI